MHVTRISVSAGRTFNHPYESFSNLRQDVSLTAELDVGEDPELATQNLQAKAEALVEAHKKSLLERLGEAWKSGF